MRVGLIPPRGLENYALKSKFHLALAIPSLMGRRTYGGMYTRAVNLGDFVILDNGLAEGEPATPIQIIDYAKQINASEIVLPDVMRNVTATLVAVRGFLQLNGLPMERSFMAVVQGKKMHEFQECVHEFAMLQPITTLGIPRHMLETLGSKSCRIDLANWIQENYANRFQLHFLGTNPVWLGEVKSAVKYAPHVRSVDTSMPFSYAAAGVELRTTTEQITRPKHYFEQDWTARINSTLLNRNINTLLEWADASGTRTEASLSRVREVPA